MQQCSMCLRGSHVFVHVTGKENKTFNYLSRSCLSKNKCTCNRGHINLCLTDFKYSFAGTLGADVTNLIIIVIIIIIIIIAL